MIGRMNTTRNGKIARLPLAVREELNRRLENGESGTSLRDWLHALPEVQSVLRTEFGGRSINAQNLTEWRQGGYREWLATQEARALAERLGHETLSGKDSTGHKEIPEMLALSLGARYFVATRLLYKTTTADEEWRLLLQFSSEVMKLRRSDLEARRLALQDRRMELNEKKWATKSSVNQTASGPIKPSNFSPQKPGEKAGA
jgi:hypothetical protein